jgi:hypothetical protein
MIRKPIITNPVTAITAFLPTEECQNRETAFVLAMGWRAAAAEGAVMCAI